MIMNKYKDHWRSSVIPVLCTLSQMVILQMTLSSTGEEEIMLWRGWTRLNCPNSPLWTISSSPRMLSSPQVMVTNRLTCMNHTSRRRDQVRLVFVPCAGLNRQKTKPVQRNAVQYYQPWNKYYLEVHMFSFCTYTYLTVITLPLFPF